MDTIGSVVTIVLVLAAIIAPQALAVYFGAWRRDDDEDYIPDGR